MEGGCAVLRFEEDRRSEKWSNTEINPSQAEMKRSNAAEIDASQADLFRSRIPELTAAEYAAEAIECDRIRRGLKDPHYKVVEALGCSRVLGYLLGHETLGVRDFCHVSFYAKPINSYSNCSDKEEERVLIFAELADIGHHQFMLGHWSVSKPDAPDIIHGCGFCPHEKNYPHPSAAGRYHTALFSYEPPDHTYQQKLAVSFDSQVEGRKGLGKPGRCQTIFEFKKHDPSSFSPADLSDRQYAERALECINMKEDAEFELVETLGSRRQKLMMRPEDGDTLWCHVCFTAKPKNADHDASPVTFFAELHDPGVKEFRLSTYAKLDGDRRSHGCGICPNNEKFPHPPVPPAPRYRAPTFPYRAGAFPPFCTRECFSLMD